MTAKLMLLMRVIERRIAGGETLEAVLHGYPGLGADDKQAVLEYFKHR